MEVIGLGYNCIVAITLIRKGIMRRESVFDGTFSADLNKLIDLLEARGADVFRTHLTWEQTTIWWGTHWKEFWTARDTKYNLVSVHDAPLELTQHEAQAQAHLLKIKQPMIDRLFETLEKAKCPHIIRSNANGSSFEEVIRLYDTIKKIRDGRPFHLHVIQNSPFAEQRWGIQGLHLYRAIPPPWHGKQWEITPSWELAFQSILKLLTPALL